MIKVYIAGKLNDDAVGYIQNCHRMIRLANDAREAGFAVFVPCIDFLQGVVAGDWTYREYFDNSQPWLKSSDAVLVVKEGWKTSKGTKREIETAEIHNIPVFFDLKDLAKWREERRHE